MVNVRLDELWPWLSALPSDDPPPGFRLEADRAPREPWITGFTPLLPGFNAGPAPSSSANSGLNEPIRVPGDVDQFEILYQPEQDDWPVSEGQDFPPYFPSPPLPEPQEPQSIPPSLPTEGPPSYPEPPRLQVPRPVATTPSFPIPPAGALPPDSGLGPVLGNAPAWPSSQKVGVRTDHSRNVVHVGAPTPGFNVAPVLEDIPGFRLPAANSPRGGLPNETTFMRHYAHVMGPLLEAERSRDPTRLMGFGTYPGVGTPFVPPSPQVPRQEPLYDTELRGQALPAVNYGIDPRYIIPVQAPPRPVGPGHNGGPPLRSPAPSPPPPQPSRGGAVQGVPQPSSPPDATSSIAGAAAAANAPEQGQENSISDPDAEKKLKALREISRTRGKRSANDQYLGEGGINTFVGIRLNPKLGQPNAGRFYYPSRANLRDGYCGELVLGNRLVAILPDEVVIHYGMPAGWNGPDVISIGPTGTISVWDSKWRDQPRHINSNDRAHQGETSLKGLEWEVIRRIAAAVNSGRLSPEVATIAYENLRKGNYDIYTIGTGNAHGGVMQPVRNHIPGDVRE